MFDHTTLWQDKLSLIPYVFLAIAIISIWIKQHYALWGSLLILGIVFGFITHRLESISLLTIILLGLGYYLSYATKKRFLKIQYGILTFAFSYILILFHIFPGFNNLEVLHQIKLTADAVPFTMFLNFDKPLIGLFVLGFGFSCISNKFFSMNTMKEWFIITFLTLITLISLSFTLNYLRFEPKWNNFFYIWILNNLIFVCVTEEAFFRGFVQRGLSQCFSPHRYGNIAALVIASILFGFVHYRGGPLYIIISIVAGLFYGIVYLRTGRIEASIATHFLINLIHILFFTYPALIP